MYKSQRKELLPFKLKGVVGKDLHNGANSSTNGSRMKVDLFLAIILIAEIFSFSHASLVSAMAKFI